MGTHVVLLRGINVGGSRRIPMSSLRTALQRAGFAEPRTLLQTGNVIVDTSASVLSITDIVETTILAEFGFHTEAIIRTQGELTAVIDTHPFSEDQLEDPRLAHVVFFKSRPSESGFTELRARHEGAETLTLSQGELFVHYPEGSGRSRLSGKAIESALGVPGTARNWNTVLKIQAAFDDPA